MKSSDFITLHVPKKKRVVLGKEEFKMIKKNRGVINASRGGLMDEKDLLKALKEEISRIYFF